MKLSLFQYTYINRDGVACKTWLNPIYIEAITQGHDKNFHLQMNSGKCFKLTEKDLNSFLRFVGIKENEPHYYYNNGVMT